MSDEGAKDKAFLNDLAARIGAGPPKKPVGLVKVPERTAAEEEALRDASASKSTVDESAAEARARMASIIGAGPPSKSDEKSDKQE